MPRSAPGSSLAGRAGGFTLIELLVVMVIVAVSGAVVTLALGLGLTVLTAVVLIEGNLARQVDNAIPKKAPAYYFLDIQPDQAAPDNCDVVQDTSAW